MIGRGQVLEHATAPAVPESKETPGMKRTLNSPSPAAPAGLDLAGLDPADSLENNRELLGDRSTAAQDFSREEAGYHKTLKPRQIQMIAIGGAIGTGLFMGAGGRLNGSGPAL